MTSDMPLFGHIGIGEYAPQKSDATFLSSHNARSAQHGPPVIKHADMCAAHQWLLFVFGSSNNSSIHFFMATDNKAYACLWHDVTTSGTLTSPMGTRSSLKQYTLYTPQLVSLVTEMKKPSLAHFHVRISLLIVTTSHGQGVPGTGIQMLM